MEHNNPEKVQVEAIKVPSRKHESASKDKKSGHAYDDKKRILLEQKKAGVTEFKRRHNFKKRKKRSVTVSEVPDQEIKTYVSEFEDKIIDPANSTQKIELIR